MGIATMIAFSAVIAGCLSEPSISDSVGVVSRSDKVLKSNEEWKKILTPEQYHILREAGTERAFTGKYWNNKEKGVYHCAGCDQQLFESATKYESGCGWPSFFDAIDPEKLEFVEDTSHGMRRIEVRCARCEGHLGHIFPDGPEPTGQRYCINSEAMKFKRKGTE